MAGRTDRLERMCADYRKKRDAVLNNDDLKPESKRRMLSEMQMQHSVEVRNEREAILRKYRDDLQRQREKAAGPRNAPTSTREELRHARLRSEVETRLQRAPSVESLFGEYERRANSADEDDQTWCELFETYAPIYAEAADEVEPILADGRRQRIYEHADDGTKSTMDSVGRLQAEYEQAQFILSGAFATDGEMDHVHRAKEGWVANAVSATAAA